MIDFAKVLEQYDGEMPETMVKAFVNVSAVLQICSLISQKELHNNDPEIVLEVYRLVIKQHDRILYDIAVKRAQEQKDNSEDFDPGDYDSDSDF